MDSQRSPEQQVHLLKLQKQKLVSQLELQRREVNDLNARCSRLEKQHEQYRETLLVVNRLWTQTNDDIQFLCKKCTDFKDGEVGHTNSAPCPDNVDPFLQRLLAGGASDAKRAIGKVDAAAFPASEIEKSLAAKAASTNRAMAQLIDLLEQHRQGFKKLVEEAKSKTSEATLRDQVSALTNTNTSLTREISSLKAHCRASTAQLKQRNDEILKLEAKLVDLGNQCADKEEELANAHRKLTKVKSESVTSDTKNLSATNSSAIAVPEAVEFAAEATQLKEQLEQRFAELEQEQAAHFATKQELLSVQAKLADETWVVSTKQYQLKENVVQQLHKELDALREQVATAQKELILASQNQRTVANKADLGDIAQRRLAIAEARNLELEKHLAESRAARQAAELQLLQEQKTYGTMSTVHELKVMIATLQQDVEARERKLQQFQAVQNQFEAACGEARDAAINLQQSQIQLQHLQEDYQSQQEQSAALEQTCTQLRTQVQELSIFVEVLTEVSNDSRDLSQCRASEAQLKLRVKELQNKLQGVDVKSKMTELATQEQQIQQRLQDLRNQNAALQLEITSLTKQIAMQQQQLANARSECDAYLSDIEATGQAYEDMQAQNTRLIQTLTERDEEVNKLTEERQKTVHQHQSMLEDFKAAEEKANRARLDIQQVSAKCDMLESKCQAQIMELTGVKEQLRATTLKLDTAMQQLAERDNALQQKAAQVAATQEALATAKRDHEEAEQKLLKERTKRQKFEDEVQVLNEKVGRLRTLGGASEEAMQFQQEAANLRRMVQCSICQTHTKSVILSKCWHMFCHECIKTRLANRDRKCPGCGCTFGQQDVHPFFFT